MYRNNSSILRFGDPMKIAWQHLWQTGGTVDRGTYAFVGLLGFALKHNVDRLVASHVFYRPWGFFNYWVPVRDVGRVTQLPRSEAVFLESMLALSLPFVWVGVVLTLKRLRSAQLSPALVAFFFVPFVNLLFFLWLCIVPQRGLPAELTGEPKTPLLARVVPDNVLGSAAISLL